MTLTSIDSTTPREGDPAPPARLSLTPANGVPGRLDGAWWPRSRDLTRELPALTDALDGLWGRITRVTVNPAHWPVIPRKVPVTGHTVHVGWFADEQDPHKLILLGYTAGRWDLLVIPPETGPASAGRLMSAAATEGNLSTASALMADEEATRAVADAQTREDAGEREGGGTPTSQPMLRLLKPVAVRAPDRRR
ncbi:DUF5994 family protein [Streptomyces sp. GC420]|uniref:DUF5994 family protein n=1 Tax=Streptomyces sp. GC420 TaxID=2697568 RepID=UPI0014152BEF|nr:DUF5994 family protein [Streptomyces sp. GC420]NBM17658.1 hypothetical protein [Streptomyces sp. GC420]